MTATLLSSALVLSVGFVTAAERNAGSPNPESVELFLQMVPVLQSPRCMNCHPAAAFPRQGDERHRHLMLVMRGSDDHGAASLRCATCHQNANSPNSGVPGAPDWHLAPLNMAWEGLSADALCKSILDPNKGELAPDHVVAHMQTPLVQWAWTPGSDLDGKPRQPPPISSESFIALTRAWIASGAHCP